MVRQRAVGFLSGLLAMGIAAGANADIIDFEDIDAPSLFLETTHFTGTPEVDFGGPGPLSGGAVLNIFSGFGSPHSGVQFLAFNDTAVYLDGGIPIGPETITFLTEPAFSVSIWVSGATTLDDFVLEAYAAGDVLVDSDTVSAGLGFSPTEWGELTVSHAAGIERIVVNDISNQMWKIDDVSWTSMSVPGDVDGDGDVDLDDHAFFADCLSGPATTPDPPPPVTGADCLDAFDLDGDEDVDFADFATLQRIFTGS